jgi:hypothetical protein
MATNAGEAAAMATTLDGHLWTYPVALKMPEERTLSLPQPAPLTAVWLTLNRRWATEVRHLGFRRGSSPYASSCLRVSPRATSSPGIADDLG